MGESLIISDEQPRHRIGRTWQEECGKCVPVLNCVAILPFHPEKPGIDFFSPSQLISHNLQFSNTKRSQLQKDRSSLGQGASDFPPRIGKSRGGLRAAPRWDWACSCGTGLNRGATSFVPPSPQCAQLKGRCNRPCKTKYQHFMTFTK